MLVEEVTSNTNSDVSKHNVYVFIRNWGGEQLPFSGVFCVLIFYMKTDCCDWLHLSMAPPAITDSTEIKWSGETF